MTDEMDWLDEELGDDGHDARASLSEHDEEPENASEDLAAAQERAQARVTAKEDAEAFERRVERGIRGSVAGDDDDEERTPLELTLDTMPLRDPAFNAFVEDLKYIAAERQAKAAAAKAAQLAASAPATPPLAFDAGLLPQGHFDALMVASQGGSRQTPAGMTTPDWVALLNAAGVR